MTGQYHGGVMTFTCDNYLVKIAGNVSAFFDDMAFLLTLADKNTMTLKDALNEPDAEEFVKAMIKESSTMDCARNECSQEPLFINLGVYWN